MIKEAIQLAIKFLYFFNSVLLGIFIVGEMFVPNFLSIKPNSYISDIIQLIIVEIMEAGMVYFLKPTEKSRDIKNKN